MVQAARLTADAPAQAVTPSSLAVDQLGAAGANIAVTSGVAATASDPAPRDGIMIVGFPSGFDARVRIEPDSPTALATDALYMGPNVWHFPVREGDQLAVFGGAVSGTISVCMAK